MNEVLLSSKNMNWCTPQDFFDKLNAEFHFVLDAAATEHSAKCANFFTPETDGLNQSWNCGGAVFCKSGETIVLLIPARTDTSAFHDYIYGKAEIRFVRGRLTFTDEDGNSKKDSCGRAQPAPFPSMIVVYNPKRWWS